MKQQDAITDVSFIELSFMSHSKLPSGLPEFHRIWSTKTGFVPVSTSSTSRKSSTSSTYRVSSTSSTGPLEPESYAESIPLESMSHPVSAQSPVYLSSTPVPQALQRQWKSRPLKVIHVSTCFIQGGIEQWLTSLVRFSDSERLNFVRCVATSQFVDRKQVAALGVPFEVGGQDSIRHACRDCDVLLVSDPGGIAPWVAEARPPMCIMVAHGDNHWTGDRLQDMAPALDHVIAVSRRVEQTVCQGFPTTVIPNGVDAARLACTGPRDETRRSLGFGPDDFVIGYVGRFSEEKNVLALIDAISLLPAHFRLLLVGAGHLREQVLEAANDRIPGRFSLLRQDNYLGDMYGAMDLFCLPSATEGYGLVVMEAMMCGTPVIVTRVGFAVDALIDRVNGVFIEPDPDSICASALLLEQNSEWRAAVGQAGRKLANETGHARPMARRYEDLISRLWFEKFGD